MITDKTIEKRFWAKVDKRGPDECWNWKARLDDNGYGDIRYNGKHTGAHRVSWIIHNGEIPEGLFSCHKCDTPSCVNPNHLFLGTANENNQDSIQKGRFHKRHFEWKLTDDQVEEILHKYNTTTVSALQLSKEYGVSQNAISGILKGRNWMRAAGKRHKSLGLIRGKRLNHLTDRRKEIGQEFKLLRASAGVAVIQIAKVLDKPKEYIECLENGRKKWTARKIDLYIGALYEAMSMINEGAMPQLRVSIKQNTRKYRRIFNEPTTQLPIDA